MATDATWHRLHQERFAACLAELTTRPLLWPFACVARRRVVPVPLENNEDRLFTDINWKATWYEYGPAAAVTRRIYTVGLTIVSGADPECTLSVFTTSDIENMDYAYYGILAADLRPTLWELLPGTDMAPPALEAMEAFWTRWCRPQLLAAIH